MSERLLQEDAAKLAAAARAEGNVVRGAILFHQGNINCATCHRATAEADRIGPNLSRSSSENSELYTDAYIVESILQPSKQIKKGYETIRVLTVDGEIVSGIQVAEATDSVTLRSGDNIAQPITLKRSEIQQIRPGTKSNMPEGLADALKDRKQFLDLLCYVLDIRDRGLVESELPEARLPNTETHRELSDDLKGVALISKLNCAACHEAAGMNYLAAKRPPDLNWSARRLNPAYLIDFIADPSSRKPGTTMPHLMGHLDPVTRQSNAEAIVHYLVSLRGSEYLGEHGITEGETNAVAEGQELFHSIGCVACHPTRDVLAVEEPSSGIIPLGDISDKYDQSSLIDFLEDPHAVRPSGRMPSLQLTHREAINLSSYLLQNSTSLGDKTVAQQPDANGSATRAESPAPWTVDKGLAAKGKGLFQQLNCGNCHDTINAGSKERAELAKYAVQDALAGCLSGSQGDWPSYQLNASDRTAIRAALERTENQLSNQERIDATLVTLNCTACHSRDGLGGITADNSSHFQTTNLNLGEQGRVPPTLTGVGAKLKPEWMRDVLVNGRSVRPYMKTRMPKFGEANVGHLVELFQKTDKQQSADFASLDNPKEGRELGLEIAGNKGLNCVACHTFQYKLSDTMPAVDLTEMAQRLKKEWFYQYMLAPQRFSPNTVMPSFWPNGKAIRADIQGTPEYQIEALWQYLLDGRQARVPPGVIREPLEIVVKDEARMLRRRYQGMGKRGIGVGYPGGVNLAYDAEQMRMAMLWRGRFVDPSGVWYGQGHGTIRTMSRPLEFPLGPELDDLADPWLVDDGRPSKHHFRGYELDDLRRPSLRYQFEDVEVEDYWREFTDEDTGQVELRRRITLSSPRSRDHLRFRLAEHDNIVAISPGVYTVGDKLNIKIRSEQAASLKDGQLLVPLSIEAGQPQTLLIEYVW